MGKTCAFLGNDYDLIYKRKRLRRPNKALKEKVKETIIHLIKNENVDRFLVGEIGGFEIDAYDTVLAVQEEYPDISIVLVVSKMSELNQGGDCISGEPIVFKRACDDFILPDKCATGYKKLGIVYRNRYIVENTDFIVAYNKHEGRAYEFCKQAKNKGVQVIELSLQPSFYPDASAFLKPVSYPNSL